MQLNISIIESYLSSSEERDIEEFLKNENTATVVIALQLLLSHYYNFWNNSFKLSLFCSKAASNSFSWELTSFY